MSKTRLFFQIIVLLLFDVSLSPNFLPHSAFCETYYVSNAGNDENNGISELTPWKTIAKVNASWQLFDDGVDILFKRGDTFTDSRLNIQRGGTQNDRLIIGAYASGQKPIIDCVNELPGAIYLATPSMEHITICDLHLRNAGEGQTILIKADNLRDIILSRIDIDGNPTRNGILLQKVDTYIIEDCTISNVGNSGIAINGSMEYPATNGMIRRNIISNVKSNDGITIHKGLNDEEPDVGPNHQLLDNVCYNCGEQGIDVTSGKNILVQKNETFNNRDSGILIGHGAADVKVDRHYSHDEGEIASIIVDESANVSILRSLIYNPSYHYVVARNCKGLEIYNNTIIKKRGAGAFFDIQTIIDNIIVKNNIFLALDNSSGLMVRYGIEATPSNIWSDFRHNIWWHPDEQKAHWVVRGLTQNREYTFEAFNSTFNQGTGSLFADPKLVDANNMKLVPSEFSPCIDAGEDVNLREDYQGNKVPLGNGVDLGAFETSFTKTIAAPLHLKVINRN